jgi:hypothetical protein
MQSANINRRGLNLTRLKANADKNITVITKLTLPHPHPIPIHIAPQLTTELIPAHPNLQRCFLPSASTLPQIVNLRAANRQLKVIEGV